METLVKRDATLKNITRLKYQHYSFFLVLFLLFSNLTVATADINDEDKNNIKIDIFFETPYLSKIQINDSMFTRVDLKDCIYIADPGDPILPVYPARILLPFNKKIKNVKIHNDNFEKISYNLLDKPVIPQQTIFPLSEGKNCTTFIVNKTKYSSDKPIFDNLFSLGNIGFLKGYKVLTVYLYPVKYIPSRGSIYHTDKISIEIEFQKNNNFLKNSKNQFLRKNKNDQFFIQNFVENPDTIKTYSPENQEESPIYTSNYHDGICNSDNRIEYVIITRNSLRDTNGFEYNLSDLIDHRKEYSGYNATTVTVEEIDSCKSYWNTTPLFNDTQAHIREFCKDAYINWDTEYILLAGDWDSTESHKIVPYRLFTDPYEDSYYNSMACDMYYSHLDNDWYFNISGGIWGGGKDGQNDIYGELFVGRITCHDAETVSNSVYKIINYETNSSYQNSWLRNVCFYGGDLGWDVTSKEYMEELRTGSDTYRTFTGFEEWNNKNYEQFNTIERIYHADIGSNYRDYLKTSIENDNFSIINHLGHANIYLPFELINWESLYNKKPFFGFSQGCLSGRFHDGESGCERLICKNKNRHAFALILNTGYGYGSKINTNAPSQYIHSFFWDYFLREQSENQNNWQIGKAMIYAQNKMASMINSYSHAWCYSWYSANLFGDPALKIKINNTISDIQVSNENPVNHSKNISLNISNLIVNISSNENSFNWTIETIPDIGKNSGFDNNGTKICNISNLTFSTTYYWYVNVTDNSDFKNVFYVFNTRNKYIPEPPISFFANPYNKNQINLTWNKTDRADYTIIEYNTTNENWEKGKGIKIYNGTKNSFNHNNLLSNTTYYYQSWSFNNTDKTFSLNKTNTNATTHRNNPPSFSTPFPKNCSTDQPLFVNWTIKIKDLDFDSFNYSIECDNNQSISENNSSNGLKYLELTNLSYDTQYKVWVNASDQNDKKNSWYTFTTKSLTINNLPIITNEIPKNNSVDVSIGTSLLSVLIKDPDGENFNWSIKTSPDIGDINEINTNNGSKKCYISNLDYSTTYKWYVRVTDGINYLNKTFSFTTEKEPQKENNDDSSSNNGPTVFPHNNNPIADACGPYYGYINEEILFNGSKSFDSDDDILTYSWDFGDGKKDTGEKTVHTYSLEGNYTVILTVSDGNIQKTDFTYAVISKKIDNNSLPDEDNYDEAILVDQKEKDDDNDGISNEDEIKLGTDKNDSSDATLIMIDSNKYYLLDLDKDGKPDLFYNPKNLTNTTIDGFDEDTILIDINGDNKWDYKYNITDQTYSKYSVLSKNKNKSFISLNYLIITTIVLSIVFLIGVMKFRKTLHLDDRLTNYIQKNNLSKEGVFYFEDNKKKNNSLVNHTKNLDKYKKSKSYQIDEIVDEIFDSKNKK